MSIALFPILSLLAAAQAPQRTDIVLVSDFPQSETISRVRKAKADQQSSLLLSAGYRLEMIGDTQLYIKGDPFGTQRLQTAGALLALAEQAARSGAALVQIERKDPNFLPAQKLIEEYGGAPVTVTDNRIGLLFTLEWIASYQLDDRIAAHFMDSENTISSPAIRVEAR